MRITCPKCQFKGLIDTAPLVFETRVACVRCGTTFDAILVEGEILTSLPPEAGAILPVQAMSPESNMPQPHLDLDAEDVLALPQSTEFQASEQAPVLEDVLPELAAGIEVRTEEIAPANQAEETAATSAAVMEGSEARLWSEPSSEAVAASAEQSFQFGQAAADSSAADYEQSMGMRLMRISPLWLLVCGVTFVSVIVLSNSFARPAEQGQHVATNYTSPSNRATNQALSQPSAPAAPNPTAATVQDVSQAAAPAADKPHDEALAGDEKEDATAHDESEPADAPDEETADEPAAHAPQPQSDNRGGLTIQVGSYNVIEQANERVARLQSAGFDARVVTVELPKRGTWYRVQAGRFGSREDATRYGNELKAKGAADSFIVTETEGGK